MAWWRDARFGMFIHWGIYSVPAGYFNGQQVRQLPGEWIMFKEQIPVATYAQFAKGFDAAQFDADAWVKLAKSAGMKYIVVTAKHHEGFAMYHTAVDDFNVYDATPFHRDPLAELAAACRNNGIKFGIYYSQNQDWHHPGGGLLRGDRWDKAQAGDFANYVNTVVAPQMKELLTNYGKVDIFWFDSPLPAMTHAIGAPLVDELHEYQPNIIWNNRLGGGWQGDTETPEQYVPQNGFPGRDWETCMTMNNSWGYRSWDDDFKSASELIRDLCGAAAKGGNYLLNIGPDSHGVIPQPEVERLHTIGEWLRANGMAIYGSSGGPFPMPLPFGCSTTKPGKLFLEVFDWPADHTVWLPVSNADEVKRAYLLALPEQALRIDARDGGVAITVPANAPDPIASVIVVEHDTALQTFAQSLALKADEPLTLNQTNGLIDKATVGTLKVAVDGKTPSDRMAAITIPPKGSVVWKVNTQVAGDYIATAQFLAAIKDAGTLTLKVNQQQLSVTLAPTGDANNKIVIMPLGRITLPAGRTDFAVTALPTSPKLRLHAMTIERQVTSPTGSAK